MKNDFLRCGVLGWCWEIVVTGLANFVRKDFDARLMSQTSLLMFPIYGMAAFFKPLAKCIKKYHVVFRGIIYSGSILLAEYSVGSFLKKKKMCPWDYSGSRWSINGVIRLDYAPGWFLLGLIYEKLLLHQRS